MANNRLVVATAFLAVGASTFAPADGPFQFHSLTPCRLYDSRPSAIFTDPGSGVSRAVPVQGVCGVPVGARAVTINVTAVGPTGIGHLTLYPTGISQPLVSSLNFAANEPALGNGGIVPLADKAVHSNDLTMFARVAPPAGPPGTVHIVLDVTGYFE
jgi:hypothetical protein